MQVIVEQQIECAINPITEDLEEEKTPDDKSDQDIIVETKQNGTKPKMDCKQKLKLMKNKMKEINKTNNRARIDLLGEQWFQGRTGNVQREKIVYQPDFSSKDKKDKDIERDTKLVKQQQQIMEQIQKNEQAKSTVDKQGPGEQQILS